MHVPQAGRGEASAMNETRIAARLLTLLASGGTLELAMVQFPGFRIQIQSAFEWLKTQGKCTAEEVGFRAARLGEVLCRKQQAIIDQDFETAAALREDEFAIALSLGLNSRGAYWSTTLDVDYQLKLLSELLATCVS